MESMKKLKNKLLKKKNEDIELSEKLNNPNRDILEIERADFDDMSEKKSKTFLSKINLFRITIICNPS